MKMEDWIKHHRFLYNYVDLFNSTFKIPMLLEYLIFISTMCFELYFISMPDINIVNIFKSLIYIGGLASQLIIYYYWPANLLSDESSNTAFYLYDIPWYNCESVSIKKNLLLMMIRSQKAAVVYAGNLFTVDLSTTTQAFKASMSYFTTLKTMGMK
uniref:OR14 n=1 Tax=Hycleus phaleratus TaxID=1248972 RepID=A0A2U9NJI7_9CUCU|nr:OR14 [Hycleus phaleratus]